MRWCALVLASALALSACGREEQAREAAASNVDLLSEERVNAILGADVSYDQAPDENEGAADLEADNGADAETDG